MKKLFLIGVVYRIKAHRKKIEEFSKYFEVTCVTEKPKNVSSSHDLGSCESAGYDFHALDPKGDVSGGTKHTLIGLTKLLKEVKPDVILIDAEPWARTFWQVAKYKTFSDRKVKLGLFSWENLKRPGIKGGVLDLIYRAASKNLDFVIGGNQGAKSLFESIGFPPEKIHIDAQIGYLASQLPKDITNYRLELRKSWGVEESTVVIGFCGRYVEEKGLYELIEAVRNLREIHGKNIELHFLGSGSMQSELEKIDAPWFRLNPQVPHHEVVPLMTGWDIFVLPSKRLEKNGMLWEEQFGHVLLNSMGAGCLTLGSRSGGIPEVLGNDESVTFEPGSSESLQELITLYLENRALWIQKVEEQKERVNHFYSFTIITERYVEHMRQCNVLD